MREIDLEPKDWKSGREKPKEPFFGSGPTPEQWAQILGVAISVTAIYFVLH